MLIFLSKIIQTFYTLDLQPSSKSKTMDFIFTSLYSLSMHPVVHLVVKVCMRRMRLCIFLVRGGGRSLTNPPFCLMLHFIWVCRNDFRLERSRVRPPVASVNSFPYYCTRLLINYFDVLLLHTLIFFPHTLIIVLLYQRLGQFATS